MASMVPYRSVFGVRPSASSLFDLFDDMTDLANNSIASKAFPVDVEDKGDGYEVKAYLTGVAKDDIDVELTEGRLSISVNVEESAENEGKNFLQKEFSSYSATRGVYLKDASSEGLSAKYADGILTVTVPKIVEKKNVLFLVPDSPRSALLKVDGPAEQLSRVFMEYAVGPDLTDGFLSLVLS